MPQIVFGAKPAVLRCSRCGKFVDWEEARLQVICACRAHLELPAVLVRPAEEADTGPVRDLFQRDFGRTRVVSFGEPVDPGEASLLVAEMKGELAGALAYRLRGEVLQIVALATDPMWQRSGVGGQLVTEIELLARARGLREVVLSTTNDNLPALYFYQRRGYRLQELLPEGLLPHLPTRDVVGFGGIPVRDEIRLRKTLSSS
jgi:ribosomal protein S18 acetylase RimI-like enzyme